MAFDVSSLSDYVELHSKEISSKAVLAAKTAELLVSTGNVQTGVKGKTPILKMDSDVTFQDGSSCGRTASGDITLDDSFIEAVPIKDLQNLCTKSLYNTYYAFALSKGQNPETEGWEADFVQYVMDLRSGKIQTEVEKLLWQGDKDNGTGNMKLADGVTTVLGATGSGAKDLSTTKTAIIEQLQDSFSKMPISVSSADDFRIFIGQDTYNKYLIALAGKNIYSQPQDGTLFGTNAKFEVVNGLNGTNKVVMTRISNLQLGLDGSDETDFASFRYSTETENWYMDFHFAVGIGIVYNSEAGIADYTPAT